MKSFSVTTVVQKSFFVLLSVLAIIFLFIGVSYFKDRTVTDGHRDTIRSSSIDGGGSTLSPGFPIPLNHSNVGSVLVHYFLTGVIDQIKKVSDGAQIIFKDDESEILPGIIITKETRISRISQPYSDATRTAIGMEDVHRGMRVDISIEYDLRSHAWITRDVFVPIDRNP